MTRTAARAVILLLVVSVLTSVSCHKKQTEILVSKEIDSEQGGYAETPDGKVSVTIPAHAISQSATLTISSQAKPPASEDRSYLASVGDCYAIQLSAGEVLDTVEVAFSYDSLDLPTGVGIEGLYPAYYDSTKGHWFRLGSTMDTTSKRLSVRVKHLSEWQLRGYKARQRVVSVWVAAWTIPPADLLAQRPYIGSVCLPCHVKSVTDVSQVEQTVSPGGDGQVRLVTLFFDGCNTDELLSQLADQSKMVAFVSLVAQRAADYDGVDLDLESWNRYDPTKVITYVSLIGTLRATLPSEKVLSVTTQCDVLDPFIVQLAMIAGWADEFRIMAYDYHMPGKQPREPGAVAPLDQVTADLVRFCFPFGVFYRNKLLLGIPMYHYQWNPDDPNGGSLVDGLLKGSEVTASRTQVAPGEQVNLYIDIPSSPAIQWDPTAKSPSFVTRDGKQIYTENVRSFSYKMNLALTTGIRGVSFWHYASGDGDTRSAKLWDAVSRYETGTLPPSGGPSSSDLGVTWTVVDPSGGRQELSSRNSEITWTAPSGLDGTYQLIATLPSDASEIAVSDFVEVEVTSGGNNPPNTPAAPDGPASGQVGVPCDFTALTTDPDEDRVQYQFDWGNGTQSDWSSLVPSGTQVQMSYSWPTAGTYNVKARAKDEHGANSAWSAEHPVVISDGGQIWTKTFGGTSYDDGCSVQQTQDGGYIIAGLTASYGAGSDDVWLIKTDADGNKTWDKTFGGAISDFGSFVQQTSDGGYIITGTTEYDHAGSAKVWLIKTDANGNKAWDKTFGDAGFDGAASVQQTSDGGYIIGGTTGSGMLDVLLIKTDANGNKTWDKTFGGANRENGNSVQQTSDGGYIIAGLTASYGAGSEDVWLIKTDANGNKTWDKTFGGAGWDFGYSGQQTSDGGYIMTGVTASYGAGSSDVWLIKADVNGIKTWDKTFGGADYDLGYSVRQTSDGGYVITGYTTSYGAGSNDVWLIKTDANGNTTKIPQHGPGLIESGSHQPRRPELHEDRGNPGRIGGR